MSENTNIHSHRERKRGNFEGKKSESSHSFRKFSKYWVRSYLAKCISYRFFFIIYMQLIDLCFLPTVASELLIVSLDLVKNRVVVMSPDMRKCFIGTILVGLIEKTQDGKVMKAITKMVEDWVKIKVCTTQVRVVYFVNKIFYACYIT